MKRSSHLHRAEGQSILVVALALCVLVAMTGLGLDGANAFNQRRALMNAVDAAAMAGARVLVQEKQTGSNSNAAVREVVFAYLLQHGLDRGTLAASFPWRASYVDAQQHDLGEVAASGSVPGSARGVRVQVRYTFDTVIMPVLGRNTLTVDGVATAIAGAPATLQGMNLIPLAIPEQQAGWMHDNTSTSLAGTLWDFSGSYDDTSGNFGSVNFSSGGSNGTSSDCNNGNVDPDHDTQTYWWCNGSQYPISVNQNLDGNPGNLSGLQASMNWRINNRACALAPVFDAVQGTGSQAMFHIIGFLPVRLTDADMTGNPKTIEARFDPTCFPTVSGAIDPNSNPTTWGIYAVNLVE